jgi:hypothetical protein
MMICVRAARCVDAVAICSYVVAVRYFFCKETGYLSRYGDGLRAGWPEINFR